jgi:lysophospholipase L1-like esterase
MHFARFALVVASLVLAAPALALALEPGQSEPKRLISLGDSITRAFDATLPADNLNQSWSNGTRGFFENLFGLPNVKSHNQRISANFGSSSRRNVVVARNGAKVRNLEGQAAEAEGRGYTYATVLIGGNDVCRDTIAELPTDYDFTVDAAIGLVELLNNLPDGSTVQVAAIPDIKRLYEIGIDKTVLGIVDCDQLWRLTAQGFPCGSMLSPDNSEADREYVRQRNIQYNNILQYLTAIGANKYKNLFISWTDKTFTYPFTADDVSSIDCYHPSSRGQRTIARETWNDGPFKDAQKGS